MCKLDKLFLGWYSPPVSWQEFAVNPLVKVVSAEEQWWTVDFAICIDASSYIMHYIHDMHYMHSIHTMITLHYLALHYITLHSM